MRQLNKVNAMKYCRWPSKVQSEKWLITGTMGLFSTLVSHARAEQKPRVSPCAVGGDVVRNEFSHQIQCLFI